MQNLYEWVQRAQQGDLEAYDRIVGLFQDMAVGYGYSLLRDFHWAEDAAQEAFIQAFVDLPALRDPRSFPGWFRKIVFKQCDRLSRRKRVQTVPLEAMTEMASPAAGPAELAEEAETKAFVRAALDRLQEKEREVTVLFYIGGYSQEEICSFLELPLTTVKKRLQTARQHLKERMMEMVEDQLPQRAPSQDARFADQVKAALVEFHAPDPDHDVQKMPWAKLYFALNEQAAAQPGAVVPGVHRAIFNALLNETKGMFPDDPVLQAIPEADDRETADELLVSVGQGNHATCRSPVLKFPPVHRKAIHLHQDVARIASLHPGRPAPEDAIILFNTLLQMVKQRFPENRRFQSIQEASSGQSIADLNSAAAQLHEAMDEIAKSMTEAEREQPW